MNILKLFLDYFLHIDKHLAIIIAQFGAGSYVLLFLVIFMETGFVITPFLPGDSLLFAAGALAATGSFNIILLWILMVAAAFFGDTVNYWIGHFLGPKAFSDETYSIFGLKIQLNKILKKKYLDKAQAFYDKHGGKAIVLARFVPIVRTFAPFVAGIGKMHYRKFISYNAIGGFVWVSLFVFSGYFFGTIPVVQHNFHYVVVAIVLISLVPIAYEWWKAKKEKPESHS